MQFAAILALIPLVAAAPTAPAAECTAAPPTTTTVPEEPSKTAPHTGVTHTVAAGRGGLHFDPENIVAEVGDIVEWHFLPANHSVAQSSFAKPCVPLDEETSFFAGFNFATTEGQAPDVFQITVTDTKPVWFYCPQTKGSHCQKGMVGVINQNFNSNDFTLAKHKELAALVPVSSNPEFPRGGTVELNPNPLSGL